MGPRCVSGQVQADLDEARTPAPERIVIVNFVRGFEDSIVAELRKARPGLAVDVVSASTELSGPDVTVFNLDDIHFGDYEEVVGEELDLSIDLDDLMQSLPDQPMAMKCLDKLEKPTVWQRSLWQRDMKGRLHDVRWSHRLGFDERKRLVLRHLGFWLRRIDALNVKAILCVNIPHVSADVALHMAARIRNVPFLTFYQIFPFQRVLPSAQQEPDFSVFGGPSEMPAGAPLPADMDEYVRTQVEVGQDPRPYYMKLKGFGFHFHTFSGLSALKRILAALKPREGRVLWRTAVSMAAIGAEYSLRQRALRRVQSRLAKPADLTRPFVYCALHVQPELTTAPLAREFAEPLAMLRLLAASLPDGVELYVKEHPAQPAMARSAELYRQIAQLPRARLVPTDTSSFDLVSHCVAVATATGTVGWEALLRGKPVLAFGLASYLAAPGVTLVSGRDQCRRALEEALAGPTHRREDVIGFLHNVASRTIPGSLEVGQVGEESLSAAYANVRDHAVAWFLEHTGGGTGDQTRPADPVRTRPMNVIAETRP